MRSAKLQGSKMYVPVFFSTEYEVCEQDGHSRRSQSDNTGCQCQETERIVRSWSKQARHNKVELNESRA